MPDSLPYSAMGNGMQCVIVAIPGHCFISMTFLIQYSFKNIFENSVDQDKIVVLHIFKSAVSTIYNILFTITYSF